MASREDIQRRNCWREACGLAGAAAKVTPYQAMRRKQLASRRPQSASMSPPQIDRPLDLGHGSRRDAIERAFAALGREMEIVVKVVA